ncbi:hypothetical protein L873DRAFT_1789591 [Choiromyces venosus 120613-1]|uniref:DDE-1 domain-containing protein n=1 Tax=Choiromyces venosus 120613-1 TaxID=1336337 RepID=A0A3N4JR03_9PEZI|nr:hypothetical protein L873DRAFT_1789591 [Choiromyces venosus 120613-1]
MEEAAIGCTKLTHGFLQPMNKTSTQNSSHLTVSETIATDVEPGSSLLASTIMEAKEQEIKSAKEDLEKKIASKKVGLTGQNLTRHRAVLVFLFLQLSRRPEETRKYLAYSVARCFNCGWYFARKVVSWEITWIKSRYISEGWQGCFGKTSSWLEDEGVQLAVREWIASIGENIIAQGLSKAVGEYLDSQRAQVALGQILGEAEVEMEREEEVPSFNVRLGEERGGREGEGSQSRGRGGAGGGAGRRAGAGAGAGGRTRKILYKAAKYQSSGENCTGMVEEDGLFVSSGREREDVVEYRNYIFLPPWEKYEPQMVVFAEDGSRKILDTLLPGEKPFVFIAHDESTFNTNDGKRKIWMAGGKQPLRPKTKGKGIMVSGFLTPGDHLKVPENIPNSRLLEDPMWPI